MNEATAIKEPPFWVPHFWSRAADRWNSRHWAFRWFGLHVWSADIPHVGLILQVCHELRIQVHLPYLHVCFCVPLMSPGFYYDHFSRHGLGDDTPTPPAVLQGVQEILNTKPAPSSPEGEKP